MIYEAVAVALFVAGLTAFVHNKLANRRLDNSVAPSRRSTRSPYILPERRFTAEAVERVTADIRSWLN